MELFPVKQKPEPVAADWSYHIEDTDRPKINDFTGKDVIYLEAQEGWPMHRVSDYEYALNRREYYSGSNVRYRVFPHGVRIQNLSQVAQFTPKAIVKCAYCGQLGARYCECKYCSHTIE